MRYERLLDIFRAALAAADPSPAVQRAFKVDKNRLYAGGAAYSLDAFNRIIVIGAGKATGRMGEGVEQILGDRISSGVIVVKDGHTSRLSMIEQVEASHPVPNEAGLRGTRRILDLVRDAAEDTLVICLLSGGASALLVAPADGLTLEDKRSVTDRLLRAGASIGELNAVRKHLSAVKGGRLAEAVAPAMLVTLILSDVIGDRLDIIASGPTAPDATTFRDALAVIDRFGLRTGVPARVVGYLEGGAAGNEPETLKDADPCFLKTRNIIVAGIRQALSAAMERAKQLGYDVEIITAEMQGEARAAAHVLAQRALKARDGIGTGVRLCLLAGGETTVAVRGSGNGGRNQELALAFALEIGNTRGLTMLSAGTDGTDGPTDAAGAVVDGSTAAKARERGLDPAVYLDNNDSYAFFRKYDTLTGEHTHVMTGPTGTNVMDMQIILIEGPEETT